MRQLRLYYGEFIIPNKLWEEVDHTRMILDQKEVNISVFGEHNCGKSTFINALIGN